MTDLLLENKKSGAPGVYGRFVADDDAGGWREAMEDVRRAMQTRNAAMFARPESRVEADAFVGTRLAPVAARLQDLALLRRPGRLCLNGPMLLRVDAPAGNAQPPTSHTTPTPLSAPDHTP